MMVAADLGSPSHIFELPVIGSFNLGATVRMLQRRPSNPIDLLESGRWLRVVATSDGPRLVAVENRGTIDAPRLRLLLHGGDLSDRESALLIASVRWMLGLDAEPAPVDWLVEMEPAFALVADRVRGFRAPCFVDLWQTVLGVVPFQQISLDAGLAILGRLAARFGPVMRQAGHDRHGFPSPEAIADADSADLLAAGFSRAKTAALQALARRALDGELERAHFETMPTIEAFEALRRLPGIGPWSASVILLRGLRRMDVFPPGDSGTARSLTRLLGSDVRLTPADASTFAARFGDRRGYLYFMFLGARQMADPASDRP